MSMPMLFRLGMALCLVLAGVAAHAAESITIEYTVWGGGELEAPAIAAFEAAHPDIKVNFTPVSNIDKYIDRVLMLIASGNPPDVFGINVPNSQRFFSSGAVLPLNALIARDGINLNDFLPGCFVYAQYQGSIYGFPRGTRGAPFAAQVMAHNRTLFNEAGLAYPTNDWTFADLTAMAKKLTRKEGDGKVTHWGMAMPSVTFWWVWPWSAGGELMTPDEKSMRLLEPKALYGLDFIRDLRFSYEVIPPPGSGANFNSGNIGLNLTNMFYAGPPDKKFDWSLTGFPRGPESPAGYARGGANIVGISSQSKKVEAAWKFVKFLVSEEVQRLEVFEKRVGNPVLRSIALTTQYLKRNEPPWDYTAAVMSQWKTAPTFPAWPEMDELIKDAVQKSWTTNQPASTAIGEIMPKLEAILAK